MQESLRPLIPFPALLIDDSKKTLVVADLHIGWERVWSERGIYIPSQAKRLTEKLIKIINRYEADRLILLGDVKQAIIRLKLEEWREIPEFFETVQRHVGEIIVIPGNHDGELEPLTPSKVRILPTTGMRIGGEHSIGLFHGHAWPSPEVLSSEILVIGHIHPVIWFRDRMGLWTVRQVWVRTGCRGEGLASAYMKYMSLKTFGEPVEALKQRFGVTAGDAGLIIVPAFNDLVGGVSINRLERRLMGPILRSGSVDFDGAELYLLDGTYLGTVNQIREHLKA